MMNLTTGLGTQKRPLISHPDIANPAKWPKADSGRCCIFEAVNIVGGAMFGDAWDQRELTASHWPLSPIDAAKNANRPTRAPPPPSRSIVSPHNPGPSTNEAEAKSSDAHVLAFALHKEIVERARQIESEQALWEANKRATERLARAVEWLAQQCRDGVLKSHWRLASGGLVLQMLPSDWNVDDPLASFLPEGGYERWERGTAGLFKSKVYIFLERDELTKAVSTFAHAPVLVREQDLAMLSPLLRLAIKLALKNGYTSPERQQTEDVRKAEVRAAWAAAMPDVPDSGNNVEAIARVMGFPNTKAIRQGQLGQKARKRAAPKK